jgi:hypothetical protein
MVDGMNPLWIALLVSVAFAGSMIVASSMYGWHSTPVFWLAGPNLPGLTLASSISPERDRDPGAWFYPIWLLVNWAFYFLLIKGVTLLKNKISK